MPRHSVIFSVRGVLTIEVDVDDKDQAYDRAKGALYDVLNGGNIEHDIREFELIDNSLAAAEDIPDSCRAGIHSWADKPGKQPRDSRCEHCGELYGDPD